MLRNLFYSVYATKHTDEWRLNVSKLCKFAEVFNGRKIVVVRSDERTVPFEEVKAQFTLADVEFIQRKNNRQLGEVEGFLEDFSKLCSLREDEITFYAHTKGVKYTEHDPSLPFIRAWRNAMYDGCLDELPRVEEALQQKYACSGCFKSTVGLFNNSRGWHYSGNFWWVSHKRLFSLNWQHILPHTHALEAWLSTFFDAKDAHVIFHEGKLYGLYNKVSMLCTSCGFRKIGIPRWNKEFADTCSRCGAGMHVRNDSEEHQRAAKKLFSGSTLRWHSRW